MTIAVWTNSRTPVAFMGYSGAYFTQYDTEDPVPIDHLPGISCISYDPGSHRNTLKMLSTLSDKGEKGYFFCKPKRPAKKPWQLIGEIAWAEVEDTGNAKLYIFNNEPKNLATNKHDSLAMLGYRKAMGRGTGTLCQGVCRITNGDN